MGCSRLLPIVAAVVLGQLPAIDARATTVIVLGSANIFGAGHSGPAATPDPASGGGGSEPPFITLNGASVVSFSSITGFVDLGCPGGCGGGPDGELLAQAFDLTSFNGISGMFSDRRQPLYGVFVGAVEPADPAPARLHFEGNTSFASLSPLLNQTFFIGDGLTGTGSGSIQEFVVPAGATRLYFGIADGFGSGSPPGGYANNSGSFQVDVSVPEPATWALLLAGLAVGAVARPRRG
jgi:hypothetical protein